MLSWFIDWENLTDCGKIKNQENVKKYSPLSNSITSDVSDPLPLKFKKSLRCKKNLR